jgi:excisionase family DNA binding protein
MGQAASLLRSANMGTHKTPGTKKTANGAAHADKRRDLKTEQARPCQLPAKPPSAAEPMLDLGKERTLTVKEVAFRLGKSDEAVRQLLRAGRLRGWQVGGKFAQMLVSEESVEEMLITGTRRFGF